MKFSIKQLAFFIAIIALLIAFFISISKLHQVEAEKQILLEMAGFKDGYSSSFSTRLLGGRDIKDEEGALGGSLLLRVSEFQKYKLRLVHYNGHSKVKYVREVDINDPLISITCTPTAKNKYFEIESTYSINNKTQLRYWAAIPGWRYSIQPQSQLNVISDKSVASFCFESASDLEGPYVAELMNKTETEMVLVCDKYKMETVFFIILER